MGELDFTLIERNDPLVTFTLKDKDSAGVETAVDLTAATVELYLKDKASSDDLDASAVYTNGNEITVVAPATSGVVTVQFSASDLAFKKRFYHLDVIKDSKRLTYAYGTITITNI